MKDKVDCLHSDKYQVSQNFIPQFLVGVARHVKHQDWSEVDFLYTDKHQSFLQEDTYIFSGCGQACQKNPKQQVCSMLGMICQIILIFCMKIDFFTMSKVLRKANLLHLKNVILGTQESLSFLFDKLQWKNSLQVYGNC